MSDLVTDHDHNYRTISVIFTPNKISSFHLVINQFCISPNDLFYFLTEDLETENHETSPGNYLDWQQ